MAIFLWLAPRPALAGCERAKMAIFLWLVPRPAPLAGSYLLWGEARGKKPILNAPKSCFDLVY